MNILKWFSFSLVSIGALNWGLVGAFNFDLVAFLFGEMTSFTRIIYTLVGICSIIYFALAFRETTECSNCNC